MPLCLSVTCYVNIKEEGMRVNIKVLVCKGYAEQGGHLGRMMIHPESFGRESSLCISPKTV